MKDNVDPGSMTWRVTPDLLGVLDASGRFTDTNPAWFVILGRRPEDVESRAFLDFIHPDDVVRTEGAFADILRGQPVLRFENRYRHADGSYRWLSWNAVPEGDVFFCSGRDVTADKDTAAALQTREEEARLPDQFVAVLGHDLRNPVAAVGAALRILGREDQSDRAREVIAMADGSLSRMTALIEDILDFARIRLGSGIEVSLAPDVALGPFLEQAVGEVRLGRPDAVVVAELDVGTPVTCDPARVAQLVSNLVGNAATHGDDGTPIRVSARVADGTFTFAVENAGAPIPPGAHARLFQPFGRDTVRSSKDGLGLGLFIARQIALGHGGDVSMTSDAARTVFTFAMPVDGGAAGAATR